MDYIIQVNAVNLVSWKRITTFDYRVVDKTMVHDSIIIGGTRRVCDILSLNLDSLPLLGVFDGSPSHAERVMRRGKAQDGVEGAKSRRGKVILCCRRSGHM